MKEKIRIEAGVPDYSSEELLPAGIISDRTVVNDNGTNSLVYPDGLVRKEMALTGGSVDVWYEYVPENLRDEKERSLVISLHGGLLEGWGQAVTSSWIKIAQREGFIVAFPNAGTRRMWTVDYDREMEEILTAPNATGIYMNVCPENVTANRDAQMILHLADLLTGQYHVNPDRVYIHGMSMGDSMASLMARYYGNRFAGAAFTGALISPKVLYDKKGAVRNEGGCIPVFQTHMELDDQVPGDAGNADEMVVQNRNYWLQVNGCEKVPAISIRQQNNFAYYHGTRDYVYREVKGRDHGQTLDEAELVWDNLFDVKVEMGTGDTIEQGDRISVALSEGCGNVFRNGRTEELKGIPFSWKTFRFHGNREESSVRGSYLMASIPDISRIFDCTLVKDSDPSEPELILQDGRQIQFARGSAACMADSRILAMPVESVEKEGILFVSVAWFCRTLLNYTCSECGETVYITDHYAQLSKGMARLIKDLLKK